MTSPTPNPLTESLARIAPLLVEDPKAAAAAGISVVCEQCDASVGVLLFFRRRRVIGEAWHGSEAATQAVLRSAAESLVAAPSPGPQSEGVVEQGAWQATLLRTDGDLAVVLALAWAGAPVPVPEDAMALTRQLAARWTDRTALLDVRAEKAQQERWFTTMDEQLRVLDRERQKFVAVVSQSDTFMFVVSPSLKIVWANRALQRYCEENGHAMKGADLASAWKCLAIENPQGGADSCRVEDAFAEGQVRHAELQSTTADGVRDLYVTFLPIRGTDGRTAEVLVMIQNLSGLDVVRRLEDRYRRLFEHSPDGMMMVEPDTGRILLANPAAERLTEHPVERLAEMNVQMLHDPEEWPEAQDLYRHVLDREESLHGEWHIVSANRRIVASITCTRFEIDGRDVTLAQYRDVTDRRVLEAELRHSQKMEAVGSLAGGVAHDFNNLLTVILGKSELLAARLGGDARSGAALETIRKAAVRGSLLTRQLLAFGRKDVTRTEVLDLNTVVSEMTPLLETLMGESTRVTIRESPVACYVRADRGHLEQVVMNLAVNARDAMMDGGQVTLCVSLESGPASPITESSSTWSLRARPGERVVLEVVDNGIGMDEETVSHIFEPFFTTKRLGEGTGLGLSIVYGIVTKAGGDIDVNSRPGRGTTFRVHLPRESPEAPPVSKSTASLTLDARVPAPVAPGTGRVLLAEDEDDLREMATEALELAGYRVVATPSGEEAFRSFEDAAEPFQLLLTDVVMTGISGGELAQKIRDIDPVLPVLFMSGYNDDAIVRHGVSCDEASFLQKPFTLDALSRKVKAAIG